MARATPTAPPMAAIRTASRTTSPATPRADPPNANRTPNNQLGDGVDENDRPFHSTFPYVPEPHQGYEHVHHSAVGGP